MYFAMKPPNIVSIAAAIVIVPLAVFAISVCSAIGHDRETEGSAQHRGRVSALNADAINRCARHQAASASADGFSERSLLQSFLPSNRCNRCIGGAPPLHDFALTRQTTTI
jgi:hypothetical protein